MIDLLDRIIDVAISLGNKFDTIVLDVRSYEQLHKELGQKSSKLTGYKEYKIEVSFEKCFSPSYFKIEMK